MSSDSYGSYSVSDPITMTVSYEEDVIPYRRSQYLHIAQYIKNGNVVYFRLEAIDNTGKIIYNTNTSDDIVDVIENFLLFAVGSSNLYDTIRFYIDAEDGFFYDFYLGVGGFSGFKQMIQGFVDSAGYDFKIKAIDERSLL